MSGRRISIVAGLAIVALFGLVIAGGIFKSEAAANEVTIQERAEMCKIFFAGGGSEGREQIETHINAWLTSQNGKIVVTGRTQSGDRFTIFITVWYRLI